MDPVTAFATAGTVATFVQMGYHIVVNTYTIYNTASGMAREDEQLGFYIEKLGKLSQSMISASSAPDLNDAEQGMESVASKCISLSNRLVEILNRSTTKDPHSLRQSAVAAVQSVLNKSKKEELKKELDECQRLFHLQLSHMISSNTIQSLKELDELSKSSQYIGSEVAALRQHILELENGVTLTDIGEEAANKLAGLLKLSSDSLALIKSHSILEALSFPKMHQRYEAVGKAHSETFDWIFQDNPERSPKALQGKILFTNWLSSGKGVFHIAGKPGSGKSTLMKFIYKHKKTKDLLNSWAAGRKLIQGKHFFWRPGEDNLEHSIVGLLQTLLCDVLEECPKLVPLTFPKQWAAIKDLPHPILAKIRFDWEDIHEAFDRLIDNRDLFETRCFFFMIDGLDEYQETRDEGYKQLIRLILNWTEKAPDQIKVCVSSREHTVFLDHFSETQGLRLQSLTSEDIYKYVQEKLESNRNFREMKNPQGDADRLITKVTRKAEGVFLWVALVVKLLDDACDDEDSFEELEQKIDLLPPELKGLFDELFSSIHESDRDKSAQTFAIALKLLKNKHGMRFSLLRYSLLDNYNVDPLFASNLNSSNQTFLDWDDVAIEKRLKRARKQLYKRCKGLLEVVQSDVDPLSNDREKFPLHTKTEKFYECFKFTPLSQRISLIHRSVQEYLEEKHISDDRAARTKNFDAVHAICQTYVAELTALKLEKPDLDDKSYCCELLDIIRIFLEAGLDAVRKGWIATLQNLDRARLRHSNQYELGFIPLSPHSTEFGISINNVFSVAHIAACHGLDTFFTTWEDPCNSILDKDIKNGSLALSIVTGLRGYAFDPNPKRYITIFRWLFDHGCSPNQAVLQCYGGSLWWVLLNVLYIDNGPLIIFNVLELFLEYGANPDFSFAIEEVVQEDRKESRVKITPPAAVGTSTTTSFIFLIDEYFDWDTKLYQIVSSRGGKATLREYIEDMRLPNVEALLVLIDRNMNAQQLDPQTLAHPQDVLPKILPPEQETDIEALVEGPADEEDSKSGDKKIEIITAKHAGTETTTCLKRLINSPLATFILGIFFSYCFFKLYG
ncbi:uncharacterized protein F4807DRAFT_25603 [Annulohypoxylon truncatum]|uniref:uncharacterized protein n=1 Tax=Annulohypoxylon truncatum TaxID=327061 RepID=UPI002008DF85|nr:uncharacterized protein F4807DRAFT_25603 [Annulohypoxylon truncatum]KAI1215199.1 hypothetical protein F4807DRAFT_25603 [Annulohypoxylon truncatum]